MVPSKITIHCSASPNGGDATIEDIRKWHLARGFHDVGYHMVILPSGEVQNGRGLNEQGAHVEGANEGNIGICLIGTDKFTQAQFNSLRYKIDSILMCYPLVKPWSIFCHYEFKSAIAQGKTCPNIPIQNLLHWYHKGGWDALKDYLL